MCYTENEISAILAAVKLSAEQHRNQRRKDAEGTPYVNHPVEVAELLWRVGGIRDTAVIVAALRHDVLEDTRTAPEEIGRMFGEEVLSMVLEVTVDKGMPQSTRKRRQIEHAPLLSLGAKMIKLADKICNVVNITHSPPHNWTAERKRAYLEWSVAAAAGLRGCSRALEECFDQAIEAATEKINTL